MCVQFVAVHHIEGYGAVGEEYLARFRVDAGRVCLEGGVTGKCRVQHHGEHGGDIAFAACHDALGIKFCQGPAPCIVYGVQQVEAADGKAL